MRSKSKTVLALFLGAMVVGGVSAGITQMAVKNVAISQEPAPQQLTAHDVAEIVRATMLGIEQEREQTALASMLEPWAKAQPVKERIYGNPSARFTIVTFSDLECPFCKRFHNTPKEVVDNSGDAVNYEFKHLALSFHNPAAMNGALMVECVAKKKGNQHAWAFIDQYFQKTGINGAGVADLDGLARSFGLSNSDLAACKNDPEIAQRVQADMELAAQAGVTGTPSSFVVDTMGGKSIQIGGAQGSEVFMNAIRSLLTEHDNEVSDENASDSEDA